MMLKNTVDRFMSDIATQLEQARKRLVETGTRNRLIHVNRKTKRGNFINVVNEKSNEIHRLLKQDSKRMKFAGVGTEEDDVNPEDILLAADTVFDEARFTDLIIETELTPDALQKRLLKISTAARTAEEEQGLNILYLAIGFLRWYEDEKSDVLRESPLILLPVELVRNARTSALDVICRDEDIVTNLPLQERLRGDFGIELPEIEDDEDWSPGTYFSKISEVIQDKPRWSIDNDGMQLGFFSFAKLLMLRDLDPENWQTNSLTENDLIEKLLVEGFSEERPVIAADARIDDFLPVENIFQVIDADSSQTKVIEEVRSGKNLVVQGPPGTGKSQTITNILAAAAHSGKKVLFVAEKMAALSVVHQRMVKVGLSDLCLELHSRTANKKAVLGEIGMTLSKASTVINAESVDDELTVYRDRLNEISNVMHEKIKERDYTPFSVLSKISRLMGENVQPPEISLKHLEPITFHEAENLDNSVSKYLSLKNQFGEYKLHPFLGVQNLDIQPFDIQRLPAKIQNFQENYALWTKFCNDIASTLDTVQEETVDGITTQVETLNYIKKYPTEDTSLFELLKPLVSDNRLRDGLLATQKWAATSKRLENQILDDFWSINLNEIRFGLSEGVNSWFKRVFGPYRKCSNYLQSHLTTSLPNSPSERLKLVDEFIKARKEREAYEIEVSYLSEKLDSAWRNEKTDVAQLLSIIDWAIKLPENTKLIDTNLICKIQAADTKEFSFDNVTRLADALSESITEINQTLDLTIVAPAEISERLNQIDKHIDKYADWVAFETVRKALVEKGVEKYLQIHDNHEISDAELSGSIQFAIFEEKWNACQKCFPKLSEISKVDRHQLVRVFTQLETKKIKHSRNEILKTHLANLPRGAVGEMGLIRGELAKKRRHKSLRYMMTHAGNMISRIKPIFLMSPISVAQYLPPEKIEFDLLVIDEASQVRPEDALGSIARAKQIVVVGDQKQLPPTSFFDRLSDNDEQEETDDDIASPVQATEMESILSLCEARGMHQSMLEWHYRSRDPSLITVSNLEFYNNRLILPPSPMAKDDFFGLSLKRVAGAYSSASKGSGRAGTNRIEAEAIVDRLTELAASHPTFSVGIVTFSKSQADMLTEILEYKRRSNQVLDNCLREDKAENVFVKNIENVQGDERDIILISVGYGPFEPNQTLPSMNFGPINSDGGERRLNVLFSRSRVACEVYTSFNPADIDLARTSKEGPKVLKTFLQFAENGYLPALEATSEEPDSDFEIDVASEIRNLGFEVDYQVGTAGFRIDIGVRKPQSENYILAVECDGATYHSALWARERDRLRQNVLEGFGWKFHRIWSTDWFHRRHAEVERLKNALEQASELTIGNFINGSNIEAPKVETVVERPSLDQITIEAPKIEVPKYVKASIIVPSGKEPHEQNLNIVMSALEAIVKVEGPIHLNELARRYTTAHGKSKVGGRILETVKNAAYQAVERGVFNKQGDFFATNEQFQNTSVRDRADETTPTTKAEHISTHEIQACAKLITSESGEIPMEDLVKAITGILGFKRTGADLQERIMTALLGN